MRNLIFLLLAQTAVLLPGQTPVLTVRTGVGAGAVSPHLFGVGVEWTENGNGILIRRKGRCGRTW